MEEANETAAAPQPADDSQPLEQVIETWWQEHFPGSPVAQVTAAWNHALAAKDELKRRLAALAGGK